MAEMQWWAQAVAELGDEALEQVASGLGTGPILRKTSPVTEGDKLLNDMHDMAVHELAERSRAEIAEVRRYLDGL